MKNIKKKIWALMSAAVTTSALVVSMTGSSVTTVRDADGDGRYTGSDATLTLRYLKGDFNPSSVRSFDFDGNGIISYVDALKVLGYYTGSFNDDSLPGPVGADSTAVATTRTYWRHYYSSSNPSSHSEYSLTVDPRDNTASNSNARTHFGVIGEDDRVFDNNTSVVRLFNGTGFIVDDHVIATAAHCVFDYYTNEFLDATITIVDGNNRISINPVYADICRNYYIDTDNDYDYALLYVEDDLSEYGTFKMGTILSEYIEADGEVTVSGFPKYIPNDAVDSSRIDRYKATGNLESDYGMSLRYNADATSGTSGGPVYVSEEYDGEEYNTVIGIHYGTSGAASFAVEITPDILKFYNDNPNIDY